MACVGKFSRWKQPLKLKMPVFLLGGGGISWFGLQGNQKDTNQLGAPTYILRSQLGGCQSMALSDFDALGRLPPAADPDPVVESGRRAVPGGHQPVGGQVI